MIVIKFFVIFFIILLLLAGFGAMIGLFFISIQDEKKKDPIDMHITITIEKEKASDSSTTPS
ncbi:MAG: hypothetical protein J1F20_06790 [Muribaculaceae bacterium]|nr:hypothetical protein [Muribaculaceae bacterium]